MGFDINYDFNKAQSKIEASKAYGELKSQYSDTKKGIGDSIEKNKKEVTDQLNKIKDKTKSYQKGIKTQFEKLLDINQASSSQGSNTTKYVKRLLIKALQNIEPKISSIVIKESLNAVGCDQQQLYAGGTHYIKVSSIDLGNLLKKKPTESPGDVLYEKNQINVQTYPFAMNRELYQRIQSGQPYNVDYTGKNYKGLSGQDLFNIQYVETTPAGETGPWYKVDLVNRVNGVNKVGQFMSDYYKTIKVVDANNIMTNIMEALSGAVSMKASAGFGDVENQTKLDILIQRILGLCFDGRNEIDVSGIAKLAELDGIDESFFEFTDVDLRKIDQRVTNIKNGVIEFEGCDDIKVPVDYDTILSELSNLKFVKDEDFVDAADNLTNVLANNPEWGLTINAQAAVDLNFVKLIAQGLISALLSPKILLPIFTMLKALGQNISDIINSFVEFIKQFKKFAINLISKIGALFVEELFNLIKKDIQRLLQVIITDIIREKMDKRLIIILKLISLLLLVAKFISDWRKCKSVIDELLGLLNLLTTPGFDIPLPLLFATQLLDGYSESRAFMGTIEELQKMGVPTGSMPDGSPNLDVLSKFAQMKAMAKEEAENGKVQIALGVLSVTPAGTMPTSAYGKKL
jgi:hypothetical protein